MKSGIYEIRNVVNGKRYIGSAVNFRRRWTAHTNRLKHRKHHSRHLQSAWNKHGSEAFRFKFLRTCAPCYLIAFEQYYLDNLRPEYNISPTAGSALGVKHHSPKPKSPETRAKMSDAHKGKTHSPEHRANMAASASKRWSSPGEREKMSARMRGKPTGRAYWLGKTHADESRVKMSESQRRWERTPETKAKISAALLGKVKSNETRERLSVAGKAYWDRVRASKKEP